MKRILLIIIMLSLFASFCFASEEIPQSTIEIVAGDKVCSPTECYTIVKELGEGAFGKVFVVENSHNESFAMKLYKVHGDSVYLFDNNLLGNETREYQRGQLLNHPQIIKSYELFSYKSSTLPHSNFLILQLVEGKTLWDTKRKSYSLEDARRIAKQLCDALRYTLALDLIYLDLHQGNLMISDTDDIMIIDLASFFTFDELFSFVASTDTIDSDESTSKTRTPAATQRIAHRANIPVQTVQSEDDLKNQKIRKFFQSNPELFSELKQQQQKLKARSMTNKRIATTSDTSLETAAVDALRAPLLSYYFGRIVEICMHVIDKSTGQKGEKIDLWADIKKLSWSYDEDVCEETYPSFEGYLNNLETVLSQ